ncbi:MAG: thioesterase family protein [Burkholderiales bacterium]
MNESLKAGLTATRRFDIDRDRTISIDDDLSVYSTPSLLYDIETVCRDVLLQHIEPGKNSVGTWVELDHLAATLFGMWVEITVTVTEVNGPAVSLNFTASDAVEEVSRGRHRRFIIGIEKTTQRLKAKLDKARSLAVKPHGGES